MQTINHSDLVKKYLGAYESKDREELENLLTEDFVFSSPKDDHLNRQKYFEHCWPNSKSLHSFDVQHIMEKDDEVFVLYQGLENSGEQFRNAELIKFDGDHIKEIQVYFGKSFEQ